jgi:hypothetical protein
MLILNELGFRHLAWLVSFGPGSKPQQLKHAPALHVVAHSPASLAAGTPHLNISVLHQITCQKFMPMQELMPMQGWWELGLAGGGCSVPWCVHKQLINTPVTAPWL